MEPRDAQTHYAVTLASSGHSGPRSRVWLGYVSLSNDPILTTGPIHRRSSLRTRDGCNEGLQAEFDFRYDGAERVCAGPSHVC